jgi:hypothetical protein
MELTDREYAVVADVWGEETPQNLQAVDQEQLVAMHDRISRAVQTSYVDDDEESLDVLLPIERKIVTVLHDRL